MATDLHPLRRALPPAWLRAAMWSSVHDAASNQALHKAACMWSSLPLPGWRDVPRQEILSDMLPSKCGRAGQPEHQIISLYWSMHLWLYFKPSIELAFHVDNVPAA